MMVSREWSTSLEAEINAFLLRVDSIEMRARTITAELEDAIEQFVQIGHILAELPTFGSDLARRATVDYLDVFNYYTERSDEIYWEHRRDVVVNAARSVRTLLVIAHAEELGVEDSSDTDGGKKISLIGTQLLYLACKAIPLNMRARTRQPHATALDATGGTEECRT